MRISHVAAALACVSLCACTEEEREQIRSSDESFEWVQSPIVNGSRTHDSSIVDLTDGQLKAFGYLHRYGSNRTMFCSGTIIAPRVVATARHCVHDEDSPSSDTRPGDIQFSIGMFNSSPEYTFNVSEIHYNQNVDAAILVLSEDATAAVDGLTPIPMNRSGALSGFVGKKVQVAGYGNTVGNGGSGYYKGRYFAEVRLASVDNTMINVDGEGLEGICDGDSGGPALLTVNDQVVVVAVESNGAMSCVDVDHMTRLDRIASWIDSFDPDADSNENPCGNVSYVGYCDGNVAVWCNTEDGVSAIARRDCAAENKVCGYSTSYGYYCIDGNGGSTGGNGGSGSGGSGGSSGVTGTNGSGGSSVPTNTTRGCSSMPGQSQGIWGFLPVIGLLALRRRRNA